MITYTIGYYHNMTQVDNFCFKYGSHAIYFLVVLMFSKAFAAFEFTGYRLGQYDLQGVSYGSSASVISYDLRTLRAPNPQVKCVVTKAKELASSRFRSLRDGGIGCLLIILPETWPHNASINEKQDIVELETELLSESWPMPVYFAIDSPQLRDVYARAETVSLGNAGRTSSVTQWFADGYHLVTPFKAEKQAPNYAVTNIKGSLSGLGAEDSLPTIVIVAHYDAGGSAPSLSFGYDSNGSGVVALLELSRILSRFFSTSKTHPKYNIQFLLTGAGKYNYLGSKYWIDALPDSYHASAGVGQSGVQFVLCLDSLTSALSHKIIHGHVSKPPKDGSPLDVFFNHLRNVVSNINEANELPSIVHKKINLAANRLAWEHERFSIRRLPAMTLSVFSDNTQQMRESITDLPPKDTEASEAELCSKIEIIGEALARYIYGMPITDSQDGNLTGEFSLLGSPTVEPSCHHVASLRQWLSSVYRAAPLIQTPPPARTNANTVNFLSSLHSYLSTWVPNAEINTFAMDKKEPELVFYENLEVKLSAFVVKPAIYDLLLGCIVAAYLGIFYLVIWKFPAFFSQFSRVVLYLSRVRQQQRPKSQ